MSNTLQNGNLKVSEGNTKQVLSLNGLIPISKEYPTGSGIIKEFYLYGGDKIVGDIKFSDANGWGGSLGTNTRLHTRVLIEPLDPINDLNNGEFYINLDNGKVITKGSVTGPVMFEYTINNIGGSDSGSSGDTTITETIILKNKFDYINGILTYLGTSEPGSLEDEAKWSIEKYIYDIDGNLIDIKLANSSKDKNQIWDDRDTLSYN